MKVVDVDLKDRSEDLVEKIIGSLGKFCKSYTPLPFR